MARALRQARHVPSFDQAIALRLQPGLLRGRRLASGRERHCSATDQRSPVDGCRPKGAAGSPSLTHPRHQLHFACNRKLVKGLGAGRLLEEAEAMRVPALLLGAPGSEATQAAA